MSERAVVINISRDLRDKVKTIKLDLTYDEFFNNLLMEKEKSHDTLPLDKKKNPVWKQRRFS